MTTVIFFLIFFFGSFVSSFPSAQLNWTGGGGGRKNWKRNIARGQHIDDDCHSIKWARITFKTIEFVTRLWCDGVPYQICEPDNWESDQMFTSLKRKWPLLSSNFHAFSMLCREGNSFGRGPSPTLVNGTISVCVAKKHMHAAIDADSWRHVVVQQTIGNSLFRTREFNSKYLYRSRTISRTGIRITHISTHHTLL